MNNVLIMYFLGNWRWFNLTVTSTTSSFFNLEIDVEKDMFIDRIDIYIKLSVNINSLQN